MNSTQQNIALWFDQTYRTRGTAYLRPEKAYRIFHVLANTQTGDQVLDIACGAGLLGLASDNDIEYTGIDISQEAITLAKKLAPNRNFITGNAKKLPFKKDTFSKVFCIGSLERMLDRSKVLNEMLRVGTDTCTFCIMVRNATSWKWLIKRSLGMVNQSGHQDALNLQEWRDLFCKNGFIIQNTVSDQWPIYKTRQLLLTQRPADYQRIFKPFVPFRFVNEFIFVLKKA